MKLLFLLLLLLYIILFTPIKINLEYTGYNLLLIRIILFDLVVLNFKNTFKNTINTKTIRKFLFDKKYREQAISSHFYMKYQFFQGLMDHVTIRNLVLIIYTSNTLKVSSFYFFSNILDRYLLEHAYDVKNKRYLIKVDEQEHYLLSATLSIKLYHLLSECIKNINNFLFIFRRKKVYGKSN